MEKPLKFGFWQLSEIYKLRYWDDRWSEALTKAFGRNAGDRRYDIDQSSHPQECRDLHALREIARRKVEKAMGACREMAHG